MQCNCRLYLLCINIPWFHGLISQLFQTARGWTPTHKLPILSFLFFCFTLSCMHTQSFKLERKKSGLDLQRQPTYLRVSDTITKLILIWHWNGNRKYVHSALCNTFLHNISANWFYYSKSLYKWVESCTMEFK